MDNLITALALTGVLVAPANGTLEGSVDQQAWVPVVCRDKHRMHDTEEVPLSKPLFRPWKWVRVDASPPPTTELVKGIEYKCQVEGIRYLRFRSK